MPPFKRSCSFLLSSRRCRCHRCRRCCRHCCHHRHHRRHCRHRQVIVRRVHCCYHHPSWVPLNPHSLLPPRPPSATLHRHHRMPTPTVTTHHHRCHLAAAIERRQTLSLRSNAPAHRRRCPLPPQTNCRRALLPLNINARCEHLPPSNADACNYDPRVCNATNDHHTAISLSRVASAIVIGHQPPPPLPSIAASSTCSEYIPHMPPGGHACVQKQKSSPLSLRVYGIEGQTNTLSDPPLHVDHGDAIY